jgi:hypothetical protein
VRVFVSHSAKDSDLVKVLRTRLDKAGVDVLDPQRDLAPGDNFPHAVGRALERADVMVILLSPDAVRSEWLRFELEYALGNARFKGRLVPVLVRPTKDTPWILDRMSVVDVTGDDPSRAVSKIFNAVNAIGKAA